MRSNIETIRILFPDTQLVHKDETTEYYRYSEDAYILEMDINSEDIVTRIILKDKVVHEEKSKTAHLLRHLPYLRGLAMGAVIEGSLDGATTGITG